MGPTATYLIKRSILPVIFADRFISAPNILIVFLCLCFASSVLAKLGETVPSNPSPTPFVTPSPSAPAKYISTDPNFGRPSTNPSPSPSAAAAEGPRSPVSEYELAIRYQNGDGVEKNHAEAAKWFRKAAEQNYAPAQRDLGASYYYGLGLQTNYAEAAKWFRKAAEQDDAVAALMLGVCYSNGQGVGKDHAEAVKWYRKAAEQNVATAQNTLGDCFYNGDGVEKNYAEAAKWYRKAAEQNDADGQFNLGGCYYFGQGVPKNHAEAVKWWRKAAEQNHVKAQHNVAAAYAKGEGVRKDYAEAVKWFHKAAEQNDAEAQLVLGLCYRDGQGVPKNYAEAAKWFRKAAEKNHSEAQCNLARQYYNGEGVPKNYVEAYKWLLLAAAQGNQRSSKAMGLLETLMSREQIAEGQKLARDFKPLQVSSAGAGGSGTAAAQMHPMYSGTGFFITEDGYVITNEHVAGSGAPVRLVTASGLIPAKLVKKDATNDLALLKAEGKFEALPVVTSRSVKLGTTAVTVGFPNVGLQGFAPKFARGEIASLAGPMDDPRFFQISLPLQPGNSGGALVDERGNVIGVVSAKLSASATLKATGELPENVNYAVKSSFLLGFLESVPEVGAKLKEPNTSDTQLGEVVERAKKAAILVLVGNADTHGEEAAIDFRR